MGAFVLCCLRVSRAICKDKRRSALLSLLYKHRGMKNEIMQVSTTYARELRWGGGMTYRNKVAHYGAACARTRGLACTLRPTRNAPSARSAGEVAHAHASEGRVLKLFLSQ